MRPISENDEFLLSQLLDGDLAEPQATALRERMAREPELQAAFQSLARLNAALGRRRGELPEVDWARFHEQVMVQVREQAQRRSVIPFPQWVRYAMPVAVAAAIAVAVLLRGHFVQTPQPGERMPAPIARIEPAPTPVLVPDSKVQPEKEVRSPLAVQYSRPSRPKSPGVITVSYKQSADLATAMQSRDKERRARPTSHLYLVGTVRTSGASSYEELPPL